MLDWRKESNETERTRLFEKIFAKKHWTKDNGSGKGLEATNFEERAMKCIDFMKNVPIIKESNGEFIVAPFAGDVAGKSWHTILGFDPAEDFETIDITKAYHMEIWSRTGKKLSPLPLPTDPNDSTLQLPHGAVVEFGCIPLELYPQNLLLTWLFYHGVPHPKGSTKQQLIDAVILAIDLEQELDYKRIKVADAINTQSYISCEKFELDGTAYWNTKPSDVIDFFKTLSLVDGVYINATGYVREHLKDSTQATLISKL